MVHGPTIRDAIFDMVRKETEKCDRLDGFLCHMSLAGGTGSGVGAYITECLQDNYNGAVCAVHAIVPYRSGEVIVQNYNLLLTLSHIYDTTDAILLTQNDELNHICSARLNMKNVTFRDLNSVACHQLGSLLLPAAGRQQLTLSAVVHSLTAHMDYKLLGMKQVPQVSPEALPFSSFMWQNELQRLQRMSYGFTTTANDFSYKMISKSVSNLIVLRGENASAVNCSVFGDRRCYSSWIPTKDALSVFTNPRYFCGLNKSALLVNNSNVAVDVIDVAVQKAWKLFCSRAYLHHYVRYGLTEDDFAGSFANMEQIIYNYREL